jgi:hypothetical protein
MTEPGPSVPERAEGKARRRLSDSLTLAAPIAAIGLLFPGVILRHEVFYERDVHLVWYGQVESFVRAVRGGAWPLWDPYVSFGHPMLANPNTQVLYPPTWINLVASPAVAYAALVFAHLAFGGVGLVQLARRLGLSRGAASCAGVAWVASGPLLSLVNVWHHLAGAAWIPWVFLAADRALVRPSLRSAALLGCALGMQLLAGSPDLSGFTGAAVFAFTLSCLEWRHPVTLANGRRLASASLALLFALGISAAQLLPTLEVASRSARFNLDLTSRSQVGSLHPLGALAKVLSPFPLGDLPLAPDRTSFLHDQGMPFLRSLYLGLPALALVLAAFRGPPCGRRRGFFAFLLATAILFAVGRHAPAYRTLVALFPFLGTLRYPVKAMALAAFAWAILVGLGFDRWRRPLPGPTRGWTFGVILPLGAIVLMVAAAAYAIAHPALGLGAYLIPEKTLGRSWTEALSGTSWSFGAAAVLGTGALAAGLWPRRCLAAAGSVALLMAVDLALAGSSVNRTTSAEFYRYRPALLEAVPQDLSRLFVRSYPETQPLGPVENPYKIAWYPKGLSLDAGRALGARLALKPPVSAAFGLYASYDQDLLGLYPAYLADLVASVERAAGTPAYRRLLELGGVSQVASLDARGLEGLDFVRELPTPLVLPLRLSRVPAPLPRTYVVGDARVAEGESARRALEAPSFDPRHEVVLALGPESHAPPDFTGTSQVLALRADVVLLQATANAPGFVVLLDTFDPGWRALVDGRSAPVLRANEAFRAVPIPEGRHLVELRYRPTSVVVGVVVSAATWLACLVLFVRRGPRADARH